VILAVSVDASVERPDPLGRGVSGVDLQAFAGRLGVTFPIAHDPPGKIQMTLQTTGVPESFLIGRDGLIYRKVVGETEWDAPQYLKQIRGLLER
jgi:cytochrome c-type biogenesis protein